MGFFGDLIERIVSRFARKTVNKAADKIADNAADKVASVAANKINKKVDADIEKKADEVEAKVDTAAEQTMSGEEQLKIALARAAMANSAQAANANSSSLNDLNTMMGYFNFGPDMEIVGVKDDAPEWVKEAYANGAFKNEK